MKVLVIAQYFPPDMGGGSTRASNVVKGLLSKNCDVVVVAAVPHYPLGEIPKRYKHKAIVSENYGKAKVYRVWMPRLPHNNAIKRAFLHLCFICSSLFGLPFIGKIDVVWGSNPNLFSFFPSFIYGVLKRVPTVRNVDDLWPEVFYELGYVKSKFARKVLHFMAWFSYAAPAAITPICSGYSRRIASGYGISLNKIHAVEVGVECTKLIVPKEHAKNRFVLMYSGVLGLGYNFDVILEAARVLNGNNSIVFVIRGVGELVPKLKRCISAFGLTNVILEDSFLTKKELALMLESADAFMLPMANMGFIDSGLPAKIFEYQAYGKPIICISHGESAKYILQTRSGLVVNPGDVDGFVEAVLTLSSNNSLGIELGCHGQDYVFNNLTSDRIGQRMYVLFESLTH